MLCSHFTQNCILYFSEAKSPYFVTKNCWKSSYICVFILSKKRCNWFHKNLHNTAMVGRTKQPESSLNHIFNALLIAVQYSLSFQLNNFGLKCLIALFLGAPLKWKPDPTTKTRSHFTVCYICISPHWHCLCYLFV